MIPKSIQFSVAFASLQLTLLEIFKSTFRYIKINHQFRIDIIQDEIDLCDRKIAALKNFHSFDEDVRSGQEYRQKLLSEAEKTKKEKKIKVLELITKGITFFQVSFLFIQMLLLMVHGISSRFCTDPIINATGILAFAFLILSYFITKAQNDSFNEYKDKKRISDSISNYYIELIERIAEKKED